VSIAVTRRLKQAAVVFVVVFDAAQLVRPERASPPTAARFALVFVEGTP
jgi:hypothetical protein